MQWTRGFCAFGRDAVVDGSRPVLFVDGHLFRGTHTRDNHRFDRVLCLGDLYRNGKTNTTAGAVEESEIVVLFMFAPLIVVCFKTIFGF